MKARGGTWGGFGGNEKRAQCPVLGLAELGTERRGHLSLPCHLASSVYDPSGPPLTQAGPVLLCVGWGGCTSKESARSFRWGEGFNATPPCPPVAVAAPSSRSRLLVALQVGQHPACRDQEAEEGHAQRCGLLLGGSTRQSLGPSAGGCAGLSPTWTQAAPPIQGPAGPPSSSSQLVRWRRAGSGLWAGPLTAWLS